MSLTRDEMETSVNVTYNDEYALVWSTIPRHITKMRRNPRFELVREGTTDGSSYAEFRIRNRDWNPVSGAKRNSAPMSPVQRAAAAARLAAARHTPTPTPAQEAN